MSKRFDRVGRSPADHLLRARTTSTTPVASESPTKNCKAESSGSMSVETTWADKTRVVKQRRRQHTLPDSAMATTRWARRRRRVSSRCEGTGAPVSATHPRARRCWCHARPPRVGPAPTPPPAPSSRTVRDRVIEFAKHTGQCWARCHRRFSGGVVAELDYGGTTPGGPRGLQVLDDP